MATDKREHGPNLTCSFCGKSQKEVKKLIAGPTVYICDECIGLCNDIIAEEVEKDEPYAGSAPIPKPSEIKAICCGLKKSLISKKFRTAGKLRQYLENMRWS